MTNLVLSEKVGDFIFLVAVDTPSISFKMAVAGTQGQSIVDAGDNTFATPGSVISIKPADLNCHAVASEQGVELVKGCLGSPLGTDQKQVALTQTRLDRCDVDGLQQLGLQQFTHPGDLMARSNRI